MKRLIIFFVVGFFTFISFAQESVKPTYDVETERQVSVAEINGDLYYDVIVEIKSAKITATWITKGVTIVVRDKNGKTIYKKRFPKSYLYGFSDGTIHVGKGNVLTNMSLRRSNTPGKWNMLLREKGID